MATTSAPVAGAKVSKTKSSFGRTENTFNMLILHMRYHCEPLETRIQVQFRSGEPFVLCEIWLERSRYKHNFGVQGAKPLVPDDSPS